MSSWLFALFVTAGLYKADPHLAFIQQRFDMTVLFFFLSFTSFLVQLIRHKFALRLPKIFWYTFGIFLWIALLLLLGAVFYDNFHYGLQKALRFLILTGWAFLGAALIITDYGRLKQFAWALLLVATVVAISALNGWRTGKFVLFAYGLGTNYLGTARIAGIGLITLTVFLLSVTKSFWIRLLLFVDIVLLFWSLFVSGGRGPVLAFVITFIFFIILNRKVGRYLQDFSMKRYLRFLNILVFISLIIVALKGPQWFPTLFMRLRVLLEGGGYSALTRIEYMRMAIEVFSTSPIWGMGPGCLGKEFFGIDIRLYPHNIFLEFAAEGGLIVLLAFIALLCLAYWNGFRNMRGGIVPVYLLTVSFFMLLNSMVSGDINDNRMFFVFLSLLTVTKRFISDRDNNLFWRGAIREH